jgi:hypothetical protein
MCIYLLLSVGVVKTTHYCMGREKSTELFSFQVQKCPCSELLVGFSGCCQDKHEILTVDDSQSLTAALAPISPDFFLIGSLYSEGNLEQIIAQPITQYIKPDFLPPPQEPLYKINCSLVLYDDELNA